jgi:hypothetical protein
MARSHRATRCVPQSCWRSPPEMTPEGKSSDRRGGRRARTLKGGRIVFNGGYSSFECTVRNLSDGGALLKFGDVLGIPNHFELETEMGKPRRKCTVRWRSGTLMGISFDDDVAERR